MFDTAEDRKKMDGAVERFKEEMKKVRNTFKKIATVWEE